MNKNTLLEEILTFYKTLADANRLKIIALLTKESLSVEQIAEMLGLNSSTVSHHLAKLSKIDLVSGRAESYYTVYTLDKKVLAEGSQRLLSRDLLPGILAELDVDAYDRKVLKTYLTPEGRIRAFPARLKKEEAILRYVVRAFEFDHRYDEAEINRILARFNEDTARLRRALVDSGFMARRGGGREYWRVAEDK